MLTSRRRPTRLPAGVLVEPVHALSLTEAVLLAREWPHLRALLDGASPGLDQRQARTLAARTLTVFEAPLPGEARYQMTTLLDEPDRVTAPGTAAVWDVASLLP